MAEEKMEANLDWIIRATTKEDSTGRRTTQSKKLKWIFVGGKGGVGKTTVCCAMGVQLAKRMKEKKILLISTDPAHNTSDAFGQRFTKEPTVVEGVGNLHVMEIDSTGTLGTLFQGSGSGSGGRGIGGILGSMMPEIQEVAGSMPGIDEAMSFGEIMRQVKSMEFDLVMFDTAPTGHTLRLLGFPNAVKKALGSILSVRTRFGGLFSGLTRAFGGGDGAEEGTETEEESQKKMKETMDVIEEITKQFKDPEMTTFIPVMIAEFLSLFETERLIQELARFEMDVSTVVVNQLIPEENAKECKMCGARSTMQKKYVEQARDLYGSDFHIVELSLFDHEIRGVQQLESFGSHLFSTPIYDQPSSSSSSSSSSTTTTI